VRSINLLKIAAEAEWLRLQALMKRQALRGAYGAIAAPFGVAVLTLAEVAAWQGLRLKVAAIAATLILLGIDLAIAAIFGVLAARSAPSRTEREALRVRREALDAARSSLAFATLLPKSEGSAAGIE
jgi:hypothetical protein